MLEYLEIVGLVVMWPVIYFLAELAEAWLDAYKARKRREIEQEAKQ